MSTREWTMDFCYTTTLYSSINYTTVHKLFISINNVSISYLYIGTQLCYIMDMATYLNVRCSKATWSIMKNACIWSTVACRV